MYYVVMENIYYVYTHTRMDTGEVFYVGKGNGRRANTRWSRNIWWNNITSKNEWFPSIVQDRMTECEANELEVRMISEFRDSGIVLCNITNGGDGRSHPNHSLRKPVNCSNGMRFDMITDAERWSGTSRRNIADAASGIYGSAGGYAWWYDGMDPKEYTPPKVRMAINQYKSIIRSDGVTFKSLSDAAKSVNGSIGNISIAARDGNIIRYGYTWSYA